MIHTLEVGIVAVDGLALSAFYVEGLGFEVDRILEFPVGTVRRLSCGKAFLKIYQPAEIPAPNVATESWSARGGINYGALHVADAVETVSAAAKAGATVLAPVTNHRPGAFFALIADPDGNVWEVLQEEAAAP
jgi:catechol 2,3-dioxygenase-like lactoylglutathione lyase family enzyme